MKQFRRHQTILSLKWCVSSILQPLRFLGRLRIPAKKETRFRDGTVQWSFGNIPVTARSPMGKMKYLAGWKRLFFRIPKDAVARQEETIRKSAGSETEKEPAPAREDTGHE